MRIFENAPEFIELDNRRERTYNPVSIEQMHKKHEALFPRALVEGKTVLDLGCCLGATGHWCLSLGARGYTGVEVQHEYAAHAHALLEKYHPGRSLLKNQSIEDFFAKDSAHYDIVALLGVLHVCTDYHSILKQACVRARETVVIEELRVDIGVDEERFCGVQFLENQSINLGGEEASLSGRGVKISPSGLAFLMREFGFESREGQLFPTPIRSSSDVYTPPNSKRYLMRFMRTGKAHKDLSHDLQSDRSGGRVAWKRAAV